MKRLLVWMTSVASIAGGLMLGAQATLSNDDHPKLMKANAQVLGALNKADRIRRVRRRADAGRALRQTFTSLQGFWMSKKKEDAVLYPQQGVATVHQMARRPGQSSAATPALRATSSIERATPSSQVPIQAGCAVEGDKEERGAATEGGPYDSITR